MTKTSTQSSKRKKNQTRWQSVKSNPFTLAAMRVWGRKIVIPQVQNWVFCIATGRCGTNTLADMMMLHPDICATHEPYPQPSRHTLEACGRGDFSKMEKLWEADKIAHITFAARNSKTYLETSHLFAHTFSDVAAREFGNHLKVIYLHRNVEDTVRSFMQRKQDPASNPWLIRHDARNIVLEMSKTLGPGGDFDHVYFRLFWYCHEVRARAQRFKMNHRSIEVIDLPTENLNSPDAMTELMHKLNVDVSEAVLERCGVRSNIAKTQTDPIDIPTADRRAAFQQALEKAYAEVGQSYSRF